MATINSISSTSPIEISLGGTNSSSMTTTYGSLYYDTSGLATVAAVGASGDVLTSQGSAAPAFQTVGGGVAISSFLATLNTAKTNVTGDSGITYYRVPFNTEIFDVGGDYNTSTGEFVAPQTGKYLFTVAITITDSSGWHSTSIGFETSNIGKILDRSSADWGTPAREVAGSTYTGTSTHVNSVYADMDASDSCYGVVMATNSSYGSNTVDVVGDVTFTNFSGCLIG